MGGRLIRKAVRGLIVAVCCLIVADTWICAGLVFRLEVSGGSMAPALMGEHLFWQCQCGNSLRVLVAQDVFRPSVTCPVCGRDLPVADGTRVPGDSLLVLRTTSWNLPVRRWQAVCVREEGGSGSLSVKRVVGLPGEVVSLQRGWVWVDGKPVPGDPAEVWRLSVPVVRLNFSVERGGTEAGGTAILSQKEQRATWVESGHSVLLPPSSRVPNAVRPGGMDEAIARQNRDELSSEGSGGGEPYRERSGGICRWTPGGESGIVYGDDGLACTALGGWISQGVAPYNQLFVLPQDLATLPGVIAARFCVRWEKTPAEVTLRFQVRDVLTEISLRPCEKELRGQVRVSQLGQRGIVGETDLRLKRTFAENSGGICELPADGQSAIGSPADSPLLRHALDAYPRQLLHQGATGKGTAAGGGGGGGLDQEIPLRIPRGKVRKLGVDIYWCECPTGIRVNVGGTELYFPAVDCDLSSNLWSAGIPVRISVSAPRDSKTECRAEFAVRHYYYHPHSEQSGPGVSRSGNASHLRNGRETNDLRLAVWRPASTSLPALETFPSDRKWVNLSAAVPGQCLGGVLVLGTIPSGQRLEEGFLSKNGSFRWTGEDGVSGKENSRDSSGVDQRDPSYLRGTAQLILISSDCDPSVAAGSRFLQSGPERPGSLTVQQLHRIVSVGEFYLIGDNSPLSRDSRHFGPLRVDKPGVVLGVVVAKVRWYPYRWGRWRFQIPLPGLPDYIW